MSTSLNYAGIHCTLCDDGLLRHIRKDGIRWYCPTCRQDMPNLESNLLANLSTNLPVNLSAHPKPVQAQRDSDKSDSYQNLPASQFS
ncbi:MAG: hypothetical protein DCF15_18730 [Phormidesmis priestleyi]|uniref:Uncharacterized protein n=1 Tax=Phormidesmis priestleyi TaxID=268141 RepID=A0A2W4WXB3_9CYAN|nr:MAG: hypothetical protein DCF15_18730 [Phormidesmis priestleyi]